MTLLDSDRIRRLEDLEEIRDLARRYAHHVWQEDVEAAIELFTEDGIFATGDREPIRGRAALLESFREMVIGSQLQPFVHNHVIDLEGENRARGWCYLDLRATMGGQSVIGSGCYDDAYVRTRAGWRFSARTLRLRFLVPITEGWTPPAPDPAKPKKKR